MTLFEYISIANSIILSLAVVRLLDTLPLAFDPARRHWTHCAFVIIALWAAAQFWWVSWTYASVASWTYAKFLVYLATPALLYSLARTLSSPDPSRVDSFRDHFQRVRKRLFGLLTVYMLTLMLGSWFIACVPLAHPIRIFQLITLIASASGFLVANPRYHAVLAGYLLLGLALSTFRIFAEPGTLLVE